MTLGIFLRLFVLLEVDCHKLDLSMEMHGDEGGPSYQKYISALHSQTEVKDEQLALKEGLKVLE